MSSEPVGWLFKPLGERFSHSTIIRLAARMDELVGFSSKRQAKSFGLTEGEVGLILAGCR